MNDCESCIHNPPSVMGGKPCGICYPETPGMSFYQKKEKQKPMFEEKIIWHEIETRPLTDDEKAEYAKLGYADYEISSEYVFSCAMPEDGQKILIVTNWGVSQDMCMKQSGEIGNDLFWLEKHNDWDGVKAWAAMPKYKGGDSDA